MRKIAFPECNDINLTPSGHSMGREATIWFSISTSFIAMLSTTSNIIIISIVARKRDMCTTVNLLISNMAISDLCSTLIGGAEILNNLLNISRWIGGFTGDVTCKLMFCFIYASCLSSLHTLLAISIDRFLAVKKPLQHKATGVGYLKYVITLIWLVSFALGASVVMFSFGLKKGEPRCTFIMVTISGTIPVCTSYATSFIVMTILYTLIGILLYTRKIPGQPAKRDRQTAIKATIMMFAVMMVFLVSWTPSMFMDCMVWAPLEFLPSTVPLPVFYMLVACHGFFNLCIYVKLNEKFRKGFLEIVQSLSCRPGRNVHHRQPVNNEVVVLGQLNLGQDTNGNRN